jgi:hypothetical protein
MERASSAALLGREFINRPRVTVATAVERGREAYEQARNGAVAPDQPAGSTPSGEGSL